MTTAALLVPCYNATQFLPRLRKQVDSLSPAFNEVLLADDGSTDNTAAVAAAMGFSVLRMSANKGAGAARNALARNATAEWIHFHDVDDEIADNYLSRVRLAATPNCDIVFHFVDFIDEDTRKLVTRWSFDESELILDPQLSLLKKPLPTMSSFLRRSLFLASGGFSERHRCFEDGDLHLRLAVLGARVVTLPEVLEWSLRRENSLSSDQHYCFKCRLSFLEAYARDLDFRLHKGIASEAERTAVMLLRFGDRKSAAQAVLLASRLGHRLPATNSSLLRLLSAILPTTLLLSWQDSWRRWRQVL